MRRNHVNAPFRLLDRPEIERRFYQCSGDVGLFEVGYRAMTVGCNYVLNPSSGQLEQINAIEEGFSQGVEYARVETYPDRWYEVDGCTLFARKVSARSQIDHDGTSESGPQSPMSLTNHSHPDG